MQMHVFKCVLFSPLYVSILKQRQTRKKQNFQTGKIARSLRSRAYKLLNVENLIISYKILLLK